MEETRIVSETPPMDAVVRLYVAAALRRPVRDRERMATLFAHSNVVRSAWQGNTLVGLLRGWTDHAFDGFVSDLAIHPDLQRSGLGKRLLTQLSEYGPGIQWTLLASPLAPEYYQRLGWNETPHARLLSRSDWNPGTPEAWRDAHQDLLI
jgi:ribosomal protein S18 acetylase RimI-like enzyme